MIYSLLLLHLGFFFFLIFLYYIMYLDYYLHIYRVSCFPPDPSDMTDPPYFLSQHIDLVCHAPVSLDQSEPGLENWRPMGGGLVTCDEGRGDMTHHISSPSVRSPGHVGSDRDAGTHYQHLITKGDTDQETKHHKS